MQIFLDSADIDEIQAINHLSIIDGITTNPSLIARAKQDFVSTIMIIARSIEGDVSVEVAANDFDNMLVQGNKILNIASNIVIKLPITWDGIRACRHFAQQAVKVNMTLCFTANQALIAAKAGATYVSPFIGRLEDCGQSGMSLIAEIRRIYDNYPALKTKILAASIRNLDQVRQAALSGSDIITMPGKIIKRLLDHPLTDDGLKIFNQDWLSSGLVI